MLMGCIPELHFVTFFFFFFFLSCEFMLEFRGWVPNNKRSLIEPTWAQEYFAVLVGWYYERALLMVLLFKVEDRFARVLNYSLFNFSLRMYEYCWTPCACTQWHCPGKQWLHRSSSAAVSPLLSVRADSGFSWLELRSLLSGVNVCDPTSTQRLCSVIDYRCTGRLLPICTCAFGPKGSVPGPSAPGLFVPPPPGTHPLAFFQWAKVVRANICRSWPQHSTQLRAHRCRHNNIVCIVLTPQSYFPNLEDIT